MYIGEVLRHCKSGSIIWNNGATKLVDVQQELEEAVGTKLHIKDEIPNSISYNKPWKECYKVVVWGECQHTKWEQCQQEGGANSEELGARVDYWDALQRPKLMSFTTVSA